ncbi:MAG: radical SAM protein [Anaerolineales bacterium]|nr:radical SAM protein [Anaerolineales bacterium]
MLSDLSIWQTRELEGKLSWYRQVADNRMPAKFRIARTIPVEISIHTASEADLWEILDEKTPKFVHRWEALKQGELLDQAEAPGPDLLDLCLELTLRMLRHCNFCRWECEVDRSLGDKFGTCKLAGGTRVSSYFQHRGEELIFRGSGGSGTIFFTSCNMRCAFCQNGDISTDKDNGAVVSAESLATMAWLLRMEGSHNINWVGGEVTIHIHKIVEAISLLDRIDPDADDLRAVTFRKADHFFPFFQLNPQGAQFQGRFNAPMLWNSNFFMSAESMKILRLLMDAWLPDLKFGPGRCAVTLARTPWYWETVTKNMLEIHGWGEDFTIRHLVMPNHVECCTRPILEWVAEFMPEVPINVMDQFHPDNFCDPASRNYAQKYEEISRRPTAGEIMEAYRLAEDLHLNYREISFEKNATGLRL